MHEHAFKIELSALVSEISESTYFEMVSVNPLSGWYDHA